MAQIYHALPNWNETRRQPTRPAMHIGCSQIFRERLPCKSCDWLASCEATGLACHAFLTYCSSTGTRADRGLEPLPDDEYGD